MASNEQQTTNYKSLRALLAAKKATLGEVSVTSREVEVTESTTEGALSYKNRLRDLEIAVVPPVQKKPELTEIKNWLAPAIRAGYITPIQSYNRDILDKRVPSAKKKKEASMTTNLMLFPHFGKDGDTIAMYKRAADFDFSADQLEEFCLSLEESNKFIGSSGTMKGLINRLVSGMTEIPSPHKIDVKSAIEFANSCLKYNEINVDYVGKSYVDILDVEECDPKINSKSDAGVPYFTKTMEGDTLLIASEMAAQMLVKISSGEFSDWASKNPQRLAVLLKNKRDYYELDKLEVKVRPYFVYPLHERLLYSPLQNLIKPILFDVKGTETESCSAVGFSWNNGGGDRIYRFIDTKSVPGIYPLFYGDDQLWVIVLPDENKYVVTPDFSHMDLSLSKDWASVAYGVWVPYFKKIDKTWKAVLKMNCSRCYQKQVITEGPLTYEFSKGVASGITGTTKFDEVASAAVNGFIKKWFESDMPENLRQLREFLDAARLEVEKIFGLRFKEGTLEPHLFVPDQEEYGFVFLGQMLCRVIGGDGHTNHYVPKPQLSKLLIAATTYKQKPVSTNLRRRAQITKLRSLYAGGGYLHPVFAKMTRMQYDKEFDAGIRPLSGEDVEELEQSIFMDISFSEDLFPSYEWCLDLFLPTTNKMDLATLSGAAGQNENVEQFQIKKPSFVFKMEGDQDEDIPQISSTSPPRSVRATPTFGEEIEEVPVPVRVFTPPRPTSESVRKFKGKAPEKGIPTVEKKPAPPVPPRPSDKEMSDTVKKHLEAKSRDWFDNDQVQRSMFDDEGVSTVPRPKSIPPERQGLVVPLPDAKKAEYNDKVKENRTLLQTVRQRSRAPVVKSVGPKRARQRAREMRTRSGVSQVLFMDDGYEDVSDGSD